MRLLTGDAPIADTFRHTYREAIWPRFMFVAIMGGITVLLMVWGVPRSGIMWIPVLAMAAFTLIGMGPFVKAIRPTNWVMRIGDHALALQFRSFLNSHFDMDTPSVVLIPYGSIAAVRQVREQVPASRDGGKTLSRETFLEIQLTGTDTGTFEQALHTERGKQPPQIGLSRTRYHHYPVRIAGPDRIRVLWRGRDSRVTPSLAHALRELGGRVSVEEAVVDVSPPPANTLDDDAVAIRVLAMVDRGDEFAALALLRERYGGSLSDARARLDALRAMR